MAMDTLSTLIQTKDPIGVPQKALLHKLSNLNFILEVGSWGLLQVNRINAKFILFDHFKISILFFEEHTKGHETN